MSALPVGGLLGEFGLVDGDTGGLDEGLPELLPLGFGLLDWLPLGFVLCDPEGLVLAEVLGEVLGELDGLVLTHAHEDHIGAVPYLWERLRCKMWATPFTAAVLKRKLQDVGLEDAARIHILKPGARFKVGNYWDIEMVTLTHSIPEPNALLIRTPAGTIFHTGDWKLDPAPLVLSVLEPQD